MTLQEVNQEIRKIYETNGKHLTCKDVKQLRFLLKESELHPKSWTKKENI